MEALAGFWVIVIVVVGIVWILLPFAVFGIKNRLDQTNATLARIEAALTHAATSATSSPIPTTIAELQPESAPLWRSLKSEWVKIVGALVVTLVLVIAFSRC